MLQHVPQFTPLVVSSKVKCMLNTFGKNAAQATVCSLRTSRHSVPLLVTHEPGHLAKEGPARFLTTEVPSPWHRLRVPVTWVPVNPTPRLRRQATTPACVPARKPFPGLAVPSVCACWHPSVSRRQVPSCPNSVPFFIPTCFHFFKNNFFSRINKNPWAFFFFFNSHISSH